MKRILPAIALHAIFIIFALWILAIKNGFMLRWYDEMSLFEPGVASLHAFLHYPGGIFRFVGTYLTQLLFYPALGASVLILIWILCVWIARSAFRFSGSLFPLCFLLPFCLLASVLQLDEACLSFEAQGYVFYNTLGFTFTLTAFWLFRKAEGVIWGQTAIAVILPLLYPVAGFFAILAAVMCIIALAVKSWKKKMTMPAIVAACSLLLTFVVPRIYYRYCPGTTVDNDFLYLKGLPELTFNDFDIYLWIPLAIAAAMLILFVVTDAFIAEVRKFTSSRLEFGLSIFLFLVAVPLCLKADEQKTEQLRASVLMTQAIEDHNWRKVVHIMSLTKESPNYTMCVLDNLARTYCGLERRPVGNMTTQGTDYRHDEDFSITAFVDVPVNHHIGRFNQSHRWATEHNVQYGSKVYFIKYIVLNALMNGDLEFARKFNRQLMATMFHKKWAEEVQRYIDDPSLISSFPDYDTLITLRAEEIMRGE
ncbi:MAG: hypothetical protein K2L11_05970 [Muribaculaceae bacterium]|nr:hypothetical protein [Muribaculaceae bacterium]